MESFLYSLFSRRPYSWTGGYEISLSYCVKARDFSPRFKRNVTVSSSSSSSPTSWARLERERVAKTGSLEVKIEREMFITPFLRITILFSFFLHMKMQYWEAFTVKWKRNYLNLLLSSAQIKDAPKNYSHNYYWLPCYRHNTTEDVTDWIKMRFIHCTLAWCTHFVSLFECNARDFISKTSAHLPNSS